MTAFANCSIRYGPNPVTGILCVSIPSDPTTPEERAALVDELRQRYRQLLFFAGQVVSLKTKVRAFPSSLFSLSVEGWLGMPRPILELRYVDQPDDPAPAFAIPSSHLSGAAKFCSIDNTEALAMKSRIACFTTDPANFHHTGKIADDLGCVAENFFPKEPYPTAERYIADLYDLDFLAPISEEREAWVQSYCQQALRRPSAVHSYNLTDRQIKQLTKHGVIVASRLDRRLIKRLIECSASLASAA